MSLLVFSPLIWESAAVSMTQNAQIRAQGEYHERPRSRRTADHSPISGKTIAFLVNNKQVCTAVTNASGAMHLAAALGVNVTALFGPTNERETRPLGAGRSIVLTHRVWCRPCMLRECPLDHQCMRGISVAAAADAARRLM